MNESQFPVITVRELVREIERVEGLTKTWVDSLQRLIESRLDGMERALDLKSQELYGRLETLNNDRVEAREKERDFVDRKAFEPFAQRVADDFIQLRKDLVTAFNQAQDVRQQTATALGDSQSKQNEMNDKRFASLESVQSKMIGAMIFVGACVPILAGLIIYVMTGN